jgi:hypothetical protein
MLLFATMLAGHAFESVTILSLKKKVLLFVGPLFDLGG